MNNCKISVLNALEIKNNQNYLFELSNLSTIDVIGENSRSLLQGQISCDIREVTTQHMRLGAFCNLQGRILSLPHVIDYQGLKLILPRDQIDATKKSLQKTSLLSRVKLESSNKYSILGFYLQNIQDKIPFEIQLPESIFDSVYTDEYYCYKITNTCYIFIMNNEIVNQVLNEFPKEQKRSELAWHALMLIDNHPEIGGTARGLFLPHRLGLQNLGYIHFNKGCYKGQEIIARTHYRAKLKHNLKIFTIKSEIKLKSGMQILDQNTLNEIGEIVDFCPINQETQLIAISSLLEHDNAVIIDGEIVILN